MTPSARKPHRFGGLQVRICGKKVSPESTVVCQLPPNHGYPHGAVAISETGALVALIQKRNGEVELWQLTEE